MYTLPHRTVDICIKLDRPYTLSLGGQRKRNEKFSRGKEGASNLGLSAGALLGPNQAVGNVKLT